MSFKKLDTVALTRDLLSHSLREGDWGVVVELLEPDGLGVAFVTASGKAEALVTLTIADVRSVDDSNLVTVRRFRHSA